MWGRSSMAASAVVMAALGMAAAGCSVSGPPATLPHATCGSASTHFLNAGTQLLSADKGALTCFGIAARHCKAASIAITEMGTDTGSNYVFAIQPGGTACRVTELSQSYSANFGGSTSTISTTRCRVADAAGAGIRLSCAGQAVLIPATVPRL